MPYDRITQAAIDVLNKGEITARMALRDAIEAKHPGAIKRARERLDRERFERKFTGNPPSWAKRMVAKWEPSLQRLNWHRSRAGAFHGTCTTSFWTDQIAVTVPADLAPEREDEAKILLAHELAHARAMHGAGHGDDFYDEWVKVLNGEGLYRKAVRVNAGRRGGALRSAAKRLRSHRK